MLEKELEYYSQNKENFKYQTSKEKKTHVFKVKKVEQIEQDDTLMTEEEFFAKIDRAIEQAKNGEVYRMKPNQTVREFLDELCTL